MGIAIAAGQLHDAKAVAQGAQPQRFRIDGHRSRKADTGGQIILVDLNAQLSLRITAQR